MAAIAASAALLAGGVTAVALSSGGSGSARVASTGLPSAGRSAQIAGDRGGAPASSPGADAPGAPGDDAQPSLGLPGSDGVGAGPVGAGGPAGGGSSSPGTGTHVGGGHGAAPTHTSSTVLPPTPAPTTTPPTSSAPTSSPPTSAPPNRRPVVSASDRTTDERQAVSLPITVSDPDGNAVSLTVSGLPSWLHLSGHTVTGKPPYDAVSLTTTHTAIRTKSFPLTITAKDSHGAKAHTTVSVRVHDNLRTMPNYIGKTGSGTPSISAVSVPTRGCAYQKSGDGTLIYWQSVAPGTVIAWGRAITYRYGRNRTSCVHVSGHWPS